jgi:hypothetical protein
MFCRTFWICGPTRVRHHLGVLRAGSAKVLTDYWISKGLQLTAGCAPATISEFERRYRIVVPPQLRAYYLLASHASSGTTSCDGLVKRSRPSRELSQTTESSTPWER